MTIVDPVLFCTRCGNTLNDGQCASSTCLAPPISSPRNRQRPRGHFVPVLAWTALVVALLGTVVNWEVSASRTLRLNHELSTQRTAAESRARAAAGELSALSEQIAGLQARVRRQPDPSAVAKSVSASVFTLELDQDQGSGFVMQATGHTATLVTNFHVVASTWNTGGRAVSVSRGDTTYPGTITSVNVADDLALVTVNVGLAPLTAGSVVPPVGDTIYVIGSPLGLGNSVTNGIVSAVRSDQAPATIQFSAPISPGNSGGPVVDQTGHVIGVAESKYEGGGAEGLGFAIPITTVCNDFHLC